MQTPALAPALLMSAHVAALVLVLALMMSSAMVAAAAPGAVAAVTLAAATAAVAAAVVPLMQVAPLPAVHVACPLALVARMRMPAVPVQVTGGAAVRVR